MKVVVSAGGRFHAIALAQQLAQQAHLLQLFSFAVTPTDRTRINPSLVTTMYSCKVMDNLFERFRLGRFIDRTSFNRRKDDLFDRGVRQKITALPAFDIFVGWANYALHSIPVARNHGAKIIIESGSCHIEEQQQLLNHEYTRWNVLTPATHPLTRKKMCTEYAQADYIMTLSSFSHASFIKHGISPSKILMVPCGVDVDYFMRPPQAVIDHHFSSKKFRVIFVGLLSLRKGIQYLLDAWNRANLPEHDAELLLVGASQKDLTPFLSQHRMKKNVIFHPPVSRAELKKLYHSSSLFVLPSIEDGFGMVLGEAMASGLPVICTTNTGGPDIIRNCNDGFIVAPCNVTELAEKISYFFTHRTTLITMGLSAQQRIQKFTWEAYGKNVISTYQQVLDNLSSTISLTQNTSPESTRV